MITAVDTNLLIDLLGPDSVHSAAAQSTLERVHREGGLIVCEAVAAEVAGGFDDPAALTSFLRELEIDLVPSTPSVLHRAGLAWRRYTATRRTGLQCPQCGARTRARCERCGEPLGARQHVVADFLIGAHAAEHADRLLTRDRGFYGAYFPDLALA